MNLLERLRATTPADIDRDLADVLGLAPGDRFGFSTDGLTVGEESVPFDLAVIEFARVLQPQPSPPSRILILDL